MTPDTSLLALRERVAKLTGPDREVDAEIAEAFGHRITWLTPGVIQHANGGPVIHWQAPHPYAGMKEPCPEWTGSVDAALTLMARELRPGGLSVEIGSDIGRPEVWPAATVRYYPEGVTVDGRSWHCAIETAPTISLALLLALLTSLTSGASDHV